MSTFVTAYLAVWLAVMWYVFGLGLRGRRLEQRLKALQSRERRREEHPRAVQSQLREVKAAEDSTRKAA